MMLQDLACFDCGYKFEELVKKDSLPKCPKCGANALTIDMAVPKFHLKGSGWSKDGYVGGLYDEPKDRTEQIRETKKEYNSQFSDS